MAEGAALGVVGLGVMGRNLALNAADHGFAVAVWNRSPEATDRLLAEHPGGRLAGTRTLGDLVARLAPPRRILLMVTPGPPVDGTVAQLRPLLARGDVVIDGGNSWFEDTERRAAALVADGLHFLGTGVSGGEEGARRGPSLMPGGAPEAYAAVRPLFEAIAARTRSGACVTHVGPGGAGHFVKMVHNGIEYGVMQLIAEAYDVMRGPLALGAAEMSRVFAGWNRGPLASFLVELTARVLGVRDPETGRPLVDLVADAAAQKGTGKWTAEAALELGVPIPTIGAALDARILSAAEGERAAVRVRLKAAPPGRWRDRGKWLPTVQWALGGSVVCAYAQGLRLIAAASDAHGWRIDLREVARIWTGGCIIRARLLDAIMAAYARQPDLPMLLADPAIAANLRRAAPHWRAVVAAAARAGVPVPAMAASLAYVDTHRQARLPQSLIQAQRDAFGAHTYRRADHPERGAVHSEWRDDGRKRRR
jgi:6-phosphogluconate dehydrogenase